MYSYIFTQFGRRRCGAAPTICAQRRKLSLAQSRINNIFSISITIINNSLLTTVLFLKGNFIVLDPGRPKECNKLNTKNCKVK